MVYKKQHIITVVLMLCSKKSLASIVDLIIADIF